MTSVCRNLEKRLLKTILGKKKSLKNCLGPLFTRRTLHASARRVSLLFFSFNGGVLLVLVLGDQVADVLVGLLELHLVHALALVPVEERLALVHGAELGGEALEDALKRGGVSDEGQRGLVVRGRTLDDAGLLVVRDPLDEVVAVIGVALLADFVDLLGGHGATEDERGGH